MADKLEQKKQRLREAYIGKGGIHGLGVRKSQGAICVYLDALTNPDEQAVLAELEKEAQPFRVIVIREERAHKTDDAGTE